MVEDWVGALAKGRRDTGLSHGELFLRYFELGGMSTALEVEAFLYGALRPTDHDHDVLAHALNECFVELGGKHEVAYAASERSGAPDPEPEPEPDVDSGPDGGPSET